MRALYFDGERPSLVDRDEPTRSPETAIVRTTFAGVCNTDLEVAKGYMGFRGTLGHELVGEVVDGPEAWLGRRVVSEINFACGRCDTCAAGLGRHCPTRRVMGILEADGAFAEFVEVPVANLHSVPDNVSDTAAAFTEPLAAAFEILEQVDLEAGQHAVVLGDGKLGLLVAQVLATTGAKVLAVGRHPEKLGILEARDIETRLASDFDPSSSQQPLADLVVDATGSSDSLTQAIAATRPRGTLALKTTVAEDHQVDLGPIVVNEIQLLGSRCGLFEPALEALNSHTVDTSQLIEATLPLSQAQKALERASRRGALKVLIECG
ncbi:MAG: alcohol dehydrogenase catalytic domain-containing protein [Myxococcota bacterium]|nr:alcohol dehydrogenase catalytic domain-containing protein [Myxococcota bacterium]